MKTSTVLACALLTAVGCSANQVPVGQSVAEELAVEDGDHISGNGMMWQCFLRKNFYVRNYGFNAMATFSLENLIAAYDLTRDEDPTCTGIFLHKLVQASYPEGMITHLPAALGGNELAGSFGNGHWSTGPIDLLDQERITAGMLALVNSNGNRVQIWVREPIGSGNVEKSPWCLDWPACSDFSRLEGAYWGNLFVPQPTKIPEYPLRLASGPTINQAEFLQMRCEPLGDYARYYFGSTDLICGRSWTGYGYCDLRRSITEASSNVIVTTWVPQDLYLQKR